MDQNVIEHLMDIKERLATIETKVDEAKERSEDTNDQLQVVRETVDEHESLIHQVNGSIKLIKWVVGVPAALAAVASAAKVMLK